MARNWIGFPLTLLILVFTKTILGGLHDEFTRIYDPEFRFGGTRQNVALYRLVGNDMPPLQSLGQLRWNTQYALDNEANFPGADKKWILNRIWNETEFSLLYSSLLRSGVARDDILLRCFDLNLYNSFKTQEDKLFYLTSQNEGRNDGITDGKSMGYEWSIILDGNTFITRDSWESLEHSLKQASKAGERYAKIPYHRVHSIQSTDWLNKEASMEDVLNHAPLKGESQVGFHINSTETFTLGDTKPENAEKGKSTKGYGQRNKSYMFKPGQICAETSRECSCADVAEGNEEQLAGMTVPKMMKYSKKCGLVLRLWSYPPDDVINTGLSPADEQGFFCWYEDVAHDKLKVKFAEDGDSHECLIMRNAVKAWMELSKKERGKYKPNADKCKLRYHDIFLRESCFRAGARDLAQSRVVNALAEITKYREKYNIKDKSLCMRLQDEKTAKVDPAVRKHFTMVFDSVTLKEEKLRYKNKKEASVTPYIVKIIEMAKTYGMTQGPYSVANKTTMMDGEKDIRYYYSARPYHWQLSDLPKDMSDKVKKKKWDSLGMTQSDIDKWEEQHRIHRDGIRAPGTVIAGDRNSRFDRTEAWYLVDNVTTLALAWFFTDDMKFANRAATLVNTWFLDEKTGMHPNLKYAQDGDRTGLIDWKDMYYVLDGISLIEQAGALSSTQVKRMMDWCGNLAEWYMTSPQGQEEGISTNNHALYFDLSVVSLSVYAMRDDLLDAAVNRLLYRLQTPYPLGHFSSNGSQPHEYRRPTAMHYVTFNLIGWIHTGLVIDAARNHSISTLGMQSLFWVRHFGDDKKDPPVLLKAIRWLLRFLPPSSAFFEKYTPPAEARSSANFPFSQTDHFLFDRILEILHYGANIYGTSKLFDETDWRNIPAAKTAIFYPLYSTKLGQFSKFSSVDPDAGSRAWTAIGLYRRRNVAPSLMTASEMKMGEVSTNSSKMVGDSAMLEAIPRVRRYTKRKL